MHFKVPAHLIKFIISKFFFIISVMRNKSISQQLADLRAQCHDVGGEGDLPFGEVNIYTLFKMKLQSVSTDDD